MIQITVERTSDAKPERVTIEGHAGFAERGQDIVCAAVSAIAFGLINATEELLSVTLDVIADNDEEGYLTVRVPDIGSEALANQVNLLIAAMISSLRQIADAYSDFVQMDDISLKQ